MANRWDGSSIYHTKDCDVCPDRKDDKCLWGVAWKYLVEPDRRKKCNKKI